jgi:hypothetical protein
MTKVTDAANEHHISEETARHIANSGKSDLELANEFGLTESEVAAIKTDVGHQQPPVAPAPEPTGTKKPRKT